jgi:hypothetical protein
LSETGCGRADLPFRAKGPAGVVARKVLKEKRLRLCLSKEAQAKQKSQIVPKRFDKGNQIIFFYV